MGHHMSIVLSVPKNLTFLIPEILARLAIAGRARTLPVPPVGRPSGGGRRILGMLKRHEVEILLKASLSKAEVARLAGVSLRSVNRIAEEVPVPCLVSHICKGATPVLFVSSECATRSL